MTDKLGIPDMLLELNKHGYKPALSYDYFYRSLLAGRLPMASKRNGRYHFARADLPAVAAALGLTVSANAT